MILDYFEEALEAIKDAKKGKVQPSIFFKNQNTGRALSLNGKMRFGMGSYMVVTGPPGTGKTSLVDTEFVMNPILDNIIDPGKYPNIYCVYRAMERPPIKKMVKFIAYMMFIATEGKVVVDNATLLQHPNKKRLISDEDIKLIESLKGHIIAMSKSLDLVGGSATPEELKQYMLNALYRLGMYITADLEKVYINGKEIEGKKFDLTDEEGRPYLILRNKTTGREIKVRQGYARYFAKDPSMVIMNINDTTNKIKNPPKMNWMETGNIHTFNMACFRDHGATAGIDINQFSKESEKDFKSKANRSLSVSLSDIKGIGDYGQNADICLSILDPLYFQQKGWGGSPHNEWPDIDVERLGGTFRIVEIFKNSDDHNQFKMPTIFLGENGYFQETPQPRDFKESDYTEIHNTVLRHLNKEKPIMEYIQTEAFPKPRAQKNNEQAPF